jgi:hypothetical protein
MALTAHALQAVKFRMKSVNNERHITSEAEIVLLLYLPSKCSGVTEICHVALHTHALRAVKVKLKSFSNEGHFPFEAETVFHPYLPSHCSVVNEVCHVRMSQMQCKLG